MSRASVVILSAWRESVDETETSKVVTLQRFSHAVSNPRCSLLYHPYHPSLFDVVELVLKISKRLY